MLDCEFRIPMLLAQSPCWVEHTATRFPEITRQLRERRHCQVTAGDEELPGDTFPHPPHGE